MPTGKGTVRIRMVGRAPGPRHSWNQRHKLPRTTDSPSCLSLYRLTLPTAIFSVRIQNKTEQRRLLIGLSLIRCAPVMEAMAALAELVFGGRGIPRAGEGRYSRGRRNIE